MDLAQVITIIGWVFAVTPVIVFVTISVNMIKGVMAEDDFIRSLVTLGIGIFITGLIMLATIRFTDLVDKSGPVPVTNEEILTENLGL